jgi:hypothetical protein
MTHGDDMGNGNAKSSEKEELKGNLGWPKLNLHNVHVIKGNDYDEFDDGFSASSKSASPNKWAANVCTAWSPIFCEPLFESTYSAKYCESDKGIIVHLKICSVVLNSLLQLVGIHGDYGMHVRQSYLIFAPSGVSKSGILASGSSDRY